MAAPRSAQCPEAAVAVQLENLTEQLDAVRDTVEMQSFGLYEAEFEFGTSDEYKNF